MESDDKAKLPTYLYEITIMTKKSVPFLNDNDTKQIRAWNETEISLNTQVKRITMTAKRRKEKKNLSTNCHHGRRKETPKQIIDDNTEILHN